MANTITLQFEWWYLFVVPIGFWTLYYFGKWGYYFLSTIIIEIFKLLIKNPIIWIINYFERKK